MLSYHLDYEVIKMRIIFAVVLTILFITTENTTDEKRANYIDD